MLEILIRESNFRWFHNFLIFQDNILEDIIQIFFPKYIYINFLDPLFIEWIIFMEDISRKSNRNMEILEFSVFPYLNSLSIHFLRILNHHEKYEEWLLNNRTYPAANLLQSCDEKFESDFVTWRFPHSELTGQASKSLSLTVAVV